ncbi:MAG TPA: PQQ-like beta-propeller repeat protein [Bacteroidales bacterium]|nr:PQQ-like beta-propeller repeat protein [Bacteroidales bacterium]HPR11164.1 PQQ-like beta-propeller repeat protein [Bacteroidales bacterium]HRW86050.1 PQQ-like beta-propeller repeat protein [Bacteroidales bacterium]
MIKSKILISAVFLLLAVMNCNAQDWPQFLGPDRNNISDQKGLLRSWPQSGPEVLWTSSLGPGYGGPVIRDGKVYLLDRDDTTGDIMRCFDFGNGKELWRFSYDAPGSVSYKGSRSVPALDGNRVYSCGPYGDLYCIDISTHKPIWNKNIMKDFGGTKIPVWAISQCPLIYGNLLIVSYSQDPNAGLVAYNKLTGDIIWKTGAIGNETYASPIVARIAGEDHIVMVFSSTNTFMHRDAEVSPGRIMGLKPQTGEILWEYSNWKNMIQVAPALDAGEGRIIVVGGYENGTIMLRVEKMTAGKYSVKELFYHNDFGDHTKPPVLHNGYFYAQFSTNNRRDGLCCMSMDGKVRWKTMRAPSFDKGSMILADGLILATDGNKSLYLIQPDPSGFKSLASAELLDMGQNWAPIALVDGKLLIRDQKKMVCVKVSR